MVPEERDCSEDSSYRYIYIISSPSELQMERKASFVYNNSDGTWSGQGGGKFAFLYAFHVCHPNFFFPSFLPLPPPPNTLETRWNFFFGASSPNATDKFNSSRRLSGAHGREGGLSVLTLRQQGTRTVAATQNEDLFLGICILIHSYGIFNATIFLFFYFFLMLQFVNRLRLLCIFVVWINRK